MITLEQSFPVVRCPAFSMKERLRYNYGRMADDERKTEELDLRNRDSQSKDAPRARDQRVRVLPTDDYIAVSPFTPLAQAIEAMKSDEGGCVIISDDGRVAGIFTERDLLTNVVGQSVDMDSPISKWMQPAVETLSTHATVGDAVKLMNDRSFRNIPLVKNGELVGSISVFDIITYLAECYPKTTMNLPPVPQVMDTVDGG
jgi:CBS domain-containing protein